MGHSQVQPQDFTSEHFASIVNWAITPAFQNQPSTEDEEADFVIQPRHIPFFQVRQSPFKNYPSKYQKPLHLQYSIVGQTFTEQIKIPSFDKQSQTVKQNLRNSVLYDIKLFSMILGFLPVEDCLNVSILNRKFYDQIYFYKLFYRSSNWEFTYYFIQEKINHQQKLSYQKMLNESLFEDSEHSLDLDRLESLFLPEEDTLELVGRVDKIMRALNSKGVTYFQGLNTIIIVMISQFNNETAYWLTLLLLKKSNNIPDNPQEYARIVEKVNKKLKHFCPKIYQRLENYDLGVQYFAMTWLMGLFSINTHRSITLYLWDLVLNFGVSALQWFIVSLFVEIEQEIMKEEDADQINKLLKIGLKQLVQGDKAERIFEKTKIYMSEQSYGSGCSEAIKMGKNISRTVGELVWKNQQRRERIMPINEDEIQYQICQTQSSDQIQQEASFITIQNHLANSYIQPLGESQCKIQRF